MGVNFALSQAACLHLTSSNDQRLVPGTITSLRSKGMSRQADNKLAGKILLHNADFGL